MHNKRILLSTLSIKGLLTALGITLVACAGPEAKKSEPHIVAAGRTLFTVGEQPEEIVSTVWEGGERGHVRIVPLEDAALRPNDHPVNLTPGQIRELLGGLQVQKGEQEPVPVFNGAELDRLAAPLATALAEAGPEHDVIFAITGKSGLLLSIFQSPVATSGRVFYSDDQLNVVFGIIHGEYANQLRATGVLRTFTPGSRARRLEPERTILPGPAMHYAVAERGDWVRISSQALTPAPEPVAAAPAVPDRAAPAIQPASPAPVPDRAPVANEYDDAYYQEVERRLKRLNRLRELELITEEEYQQRRRVIISEL